MLWNYDDSWREKFETCEHRDILIVPHGTNVKKVPRKPPEVTSKVPKLDDDDQPIEGEFLPVEFVITNDDIVKEKFEYTNSLDTNEDLAFCGCESAMVKFTIRNNKTFNEETGKWESDIPNLQNYVITDENDNTIVGEVQTHYIIKVYVYFNGDSDSLIYLGMFVVEEDKVSSDGYTRDITAFDFLYTIRDMDVHNWYVHLFRGVNWKTNDFEKYFENRKEPFPEGYTPTETWNEGWAREAKSCWTVREMLEDLIKNICTRYPDQKTVTNREKNKEDRTDNPDGAKQISNYYTNDSEPYTGLALPMVIDPDILDSTKKYNIPESVDPDAHECYGYMDIMELKVYEDPKIMDAGALSAGKFLEDIGALAGRYPSIRIDDIVDDDYHALSKWDPTNPDPDHYYPYNLYEKCILTFKPLPKNDAKIVPDNYFDNHDIAKGFKHDMYSVGTIHIWELYTRFDDANKPTFSYANLTKAQNKQQELSPGSLKKVQMSNNMFIDYLAKEKDDIKLSKDYPPDPEPSTDELLTNYTKLRNILMYGEDVIEPVTKNQKNGLLHQGYADIKYRTYTPYELTTFADPVREPGDRIKIHFEDKVTGEVYDFDTYILSRKISGIQKMMDTYVAKGATANVTFSNYKTGTTYAPQSMGYYGGGSSGSVRTAGGTNLTGLTANDFVEIIRNIGFRLLNEPSSVSARFVATSTKESNDNPIQITYEDYPLYPGESDIHDGDTNNVLSIYKDDNLSSYEAKVGDYVEYWNRPGDGYEYETYSTPLYVWTGSKWVYCADNTSGSASINEFWNYSEYGFVISEVADGTICQNSSCDTVTITSTSQEYYNVKKQKENTSHYFYTVIDTVDPDWTIIPDGTKIKVKYGDYIEETNDGALTYAFPGYWTGGYPPIGTPVTVNEPPHVELKWTDPENIAEWEPKPCSWEGTIVVRKLNSPPLNRWDGVLITDSTVRDQYSENALIDDTIQVNRVYYYGIFPYYTAIQDAQHPIKYYRFTKVIRVSTGKTLDAPEILSIERVS